MAYHIPINISPQNPYFFTPTISAPRHIDLWNCGKVTDHSQTMFYVGLTHPDPIPGHFNAQWRTKCAVINWKCAVTKTIYQSMEMFRSTDLQSTNVQCLLWSGTVHSLTLCNTHLVHESIHNVTVTVVSRRQNTAEPAMLYRPSVFPSICYTGSINQKRLLKIMQFYRTVAPYF